MSDLIDNEDPNPIYSPGDIALTQWMVGFDNSGSIPGTTEVAERIMGRYGHRDQGDETAFQLAVIDKLIASYEGMTDTAIDAFTRWFEKKQVYPDGDAFNKKTRYDQAEALIHWLEARTGEQ